MTPSETCLKLVKSEEGCILHGYQGRADRPGLITIGYGTTLYPNGTRPKLGDTCTQEQADQWLMDGLRLRAITLTHAIDLNDGHFDQNQFDAMLSFSYNLGMPALIAESTLWRKALKESMDLEIFLYTKDAHGVPKVASCEFMKWVYANGVVLDDLIWRRSREADLYAGKPFKFKS